MYAMGLALLALSAPCCSGGCSYTYYLVAKTDGTTITGIGGGPSLNNTGMAAFMATVPNGNAIFAGPFNNVQNITGNFEAFRFDFYLRINDAGQVASDDTTPGYSSVRIWNVATPNKYIPIDQASSAVAAFVIPTINNGGQIAYMKVGNSDVLISKDPLDNYQLDVYQAITGVARPVIADNGSIVVKFGSATTSGSIGVFDSTLTSSTAIATAGSGEAFTSLDSLPGISGDGQTVAFYGVDSNGVQGIFIVTAGSAGFSGSTPYRVAGADNGFTSFQTFSHVSVKTRSDSSGIGNVAYIGTQNGVLGLYVTEFQSLGATTAPLVCTPSAVVTNGQSLCGVSGLRAIQSFSIQDPLDTNGNVAFLAQDSAGTKAIILARPSLGMAAAALAQMAADLDLPFQSSPPPRPLPLTYVSGGKGYDYASKPARYVRSATAIAAGYTYCQRALVHGLDCSGLVMWSYNTSVGAKTYMKDGPVKYESAAAQFRNNVVRFDDDSNLLPGDLLFFYNLDRDKKTGNPDNYVDHVAMYVGGSDASNVVSASSTAVGVVYRSVAFYEKVQQCDSSNRALIKFGRVRGATDPVPMFGQPWPVADWTPAPPVQIPGKCPVDLMVTDPDGYTISSTNFIDGAEEYLREVPGQLYYSIYDFDTNGDPSPIVTAPSLKPGNYLVKVTPRADAQTNEVYSLDFIGAGTTNNLAENVQVSEIPPLGYGVQSTGMGITQAAPVIPAFTVDTQENVPLSIPIATLLSWAGATQGGSISATNLASAQGGTIALGSTSITYTPPNGFVGQDQFTYTVSDASQTAQGTIAVMVSQPSQLLNQFSISMDGTCANLSFQGTPATSYVIQWAPSPTGPWTDFLPAITAKANGQLSYTDCVYAAAHYYRTRTSP